MESTILPYTITYSLTEQDFLTNQLYFSSNSSTIQKKRSFNRISPMFFYILLGFFFHFSLERTGLGILFCLTGFLWFFIYPIYERKKYFKHYEKHVAENYKGRVNQEAELTVEKDRLYIKDDGSEGSIKIEIINDLVELKEIFLLRLDTGQNLIVPKREIADVETFKAVFAAVALPFVDDRAWIWK